MLKKILLLLVCVCTLHTAFAQKKWFSLYADSAKLLKDGAQEVLASSQ